jgi:hypothetical protein
VQRQSAGQWAGNEADAFMPQGSEVLYSLANTIRIVYANVTYARCFWPNVHEDQRQVPEAEVIKQIVFHAKCKYRDSIHPALNHSSNSELHALGVVNRGCEENFVMLFNGQSFKSLDYFWEKWIGDFGNNQTKNAAAPRNQCTRRAVGVVSQLVTSRRVLPIGCLRSLLG